MKIVELKRWLLQWDSGEFDLTEKLETKLPPEVESEHHEAWESMPIRDVEISEMEIFRKLYPVLTIILCSVMIFFFFVTVLDLPTFDAADSPAHNEVMKRYIESGMTETGAVNIVAGVILDYRAFDTLGESHVLYTACTAVFILLLGFGESRPEPTRERLISQGDMLLGRTAKFIVPVVILFGIYVILNGHLGPGGGFSGGALIGAGLILYAIAFGFDRLDRFLNLRIFRIIVLCALSFYSVMKCYSFFCGANHIETFISAGIPGRILSAGLILPLNIAVGIVVACTMYGFYSVFKRGRI